jgi:hypothetical protein
MKIARRAWEPALLLAGALDCAAEPCVLRDQNVPPYYLGSGMHMAEPPGASVELVRDIAASAGCTLEPVRLPPARLQISLENGIIDIAGIGNSSPASDKLAYPRDKTGKLDAGRGLQQNSATEGGSQRTLYSVLSYDLSRRTSVLASLDLNRWQGGWGGFWGASAASLAAYQPDGSDTRRTVSLGIRHAF